MTQLEKELLELVANLTKKIVKLKTDIKNSQEIQKSENVYYSKYQKLKAENLDLQEKVSELETKISMITFELEKRNKALMHAKNQSLKGMEL